MIDKKTKRIIAYLAKFLLKIFDRLNGIVCWNWIEEQASS